MSLLAFLVGFNLAMSSPTLILEKVRTVDDPRVFDLRDDINGDRGAPRSCSPAAGTTVVLTSANDAMLDVERGGVRKRIVVQDVRGLRRSTLACGDGDDFFYADPRHGRVYAYSVDRLFSGDDPVVWTRRVEPFVSIDDAGGVMADASVATALLVRQSLVLVEWFFRKGGTTGFWHEVLDAATGDSLERIGPSDLLAKTNARDPWWILFQGGGNDTVNYVPRNIYRLRYGRPVDGARAATDVLEALRGQPGAQRSKAVATLSPNPVINHMIALLTPTRTAGDSTIAFCPQVPAQRARYWLGAEYDETLGALARNILLAFWLERQTADAKDSPINAWFQQEIAPNEPMTTLLRHFDPQDDAWIARYQEALLALGGRTLRRIFTQYGTATGAVVRDPS